MGEIDSSIQRCWSPWASLSSVSLAIVELRWEWLCCSLTCSVWVCWSTCSSCCNNIFNFWFAFWSTNSSNCGLVSIDLNGPGAFPVLEVEGVGVVSVHVAVVTVVVGGVMFVCVVVVDVVVCVSEFVEVIFTPFYLGWLIKENDKIYIHWSHTHILHFLQNTKDQCKNISIMIRFQQNL